MNFELTGKLIEKFNEQVISEKFKKREFVIETNDNGFTESIKFQTVQDKTALIEPYQVGSDVKVFFNIKGNKWKDNYFVNLQAWKVEAGSGAADAGSPPPAIDDMPAPSAEDDLPF